MTGEVRPISHVEAFRIFLHLRLSLFGILLHLSRIVDRSDLACPVLLLFGIERVMWTERLLGVDMIFVDPGALWHLVLLVVNVIRLLLYLVFQLLLVCRLVLRLLPRTYALNPLLLVLLLP